MKPVLGLTAIWLACSPTLAPAQVTGVVTDSSATLRFRPGLKPADTGVHVFSGPEISGSMGGEAFGSGGAFGSTSRIDPDDIEFQNGNASGGFYAAISSHTSVNITFSNDTGSAIAPRLHSTIVPAGLGLFLDGACLDELSACGTGHSYPGDAHTFQDFTLSHGPPGAGAIAGASFDFRISSGSTTLYSLSGGLEMVWDPVSGTNIIVTSFDAASAALTGFRLTAPAGSQREFGVAWDATDIDVGFPSGLLLAPGEASSLTYETTVESFTRSLCFQPSTAACLIAYSSFGDPVGRGGGIRPDLAAATISKGLSFDTFSFGDPTLEDNILHFDLLSPPSVAEPAAWAMMIGGFGLIGTAMRRASVRKPGAVL